MNAKLETAKQPTFTRPEIYLALIIALYAMGGYLLALAYGLEDKFKPALYVDTTALCTLVYAIGYSLYRIARIYYIIIFVRPKNLAAYLKADFMAGPFNRERYVRALPVFLSFIVLFSTYTSIKSMIPDINPFSWDEFWADADKFIHFGVDPWKILHPLLGYPPVSKTVNLIYNYWLFIKYFILYWMLFSLKKPLIRMQFFYTYAFCWIINGSLLAILFSSAGPCFYQEVTGSDRFEPLMQYLAGVNPEKPLWALSTQAMLWEGHIGRTLEFGSGISAMPSLHVATVFMFMLVGMHSHPVLKISSVLFYFSILIGSVHLGWHYAVDGYLATASTYLMWLISGRLLKSQYL